LVDGGGVIAAAGIPTPTVPILTFSICHTFDGYCEEVFSFS